MDWGKGEDVKPLKGLERVYEILGFTEKSALKTGEGKDGAVESAVEGKVEVSGNGKEQVDVVQNVGETKIVKDQVDVRETKIKKDQVDVSQNVGETKIDGEKVISGDIVNDKLNVEKPVLDVKNVQSDNQAGMVKNTVEKLEEKNEKTEEKSEETKSEETKSEETKTGEGDKEKQKYTAEEEQVMKFVQNMSNTEKAWPPDTNWPYPLIALGIIVVVGAIYIHFTQREERLEQLYDEIRWGSELDRFLHFPKLPRYMIFDTIGVQTSHKMHNMGFSDILLDIIFNPHNEQERLDAIRIFCIFTRNRALRKDLVDIGALQVLRGHINADNLYCLYAISNLSSTEKGSLEILADPMIMDSLVDSLNYTMCRGSWEDRYAQRALYITLSNVAFFAKELDGLIPYSEKLDILVANPDFYSDPIIINERSILGMALVNLNNEKSTKAYFPRLTSALETGSISRASQSTFEVLFTINLISTMSLGYVYSAVVNKIATIPVKLNLFQVRWTRKNNIYSALLAGVAYVIFESHIKLLRQTTNRLDGEEDIINRQFPLSVLSYELYVPLFYFAIRFARNFIVPALAPVKIITDYPPYYLMMLPYLRDIQSTLGYETEIIDQSDEQLNSFLKMADPLKV